MRNEPVETVRHVAVLALPGSHLSSIGVVLDSFALVARQILEQFQRAMQTRVCLLSSDRGVTHVAGGRELSCDGDLQGDSLYRIVYLPAFQGGSELALLKMLEQAQPLTNWLRHQHANGAVLAGSGTAVLLLAQSGLLDRGAAAVSKPLAPLFRRRFPRVRADTRASLVEHSGIHTCSVPTGEWSLVLRLIEQSISPHSAQWLASAMGLSAGHRESSLTSDDPLVASAQFWLAQRFTRPFRISDLARMLAVSHATLIRRFESRLGMTPHEYARHLRIEDAKRMLLNTRSTIEQVATSLGYADVRTLRAAFREHTGMSPSAWRLNSTPSKTE